MKLVPAGVIEASDIKLTISSVSPRVNAEASIKAGSLKVDVTATTDITAMSGIRLSEEYVSGKIGSLEVPLKSVSL